MTAEPKFLRRLGVTREHSTGWCTQCPDTHASSGYAVLISLDERAGRYRFTCAEAVNGDLCGNERDLVRMLGLEEADLHIAGLLDARTCSQRCRDRLAHLRRRGQTGGTHAEKERRKVERRRQRRRGEA